MGLYSIFDVFEAEGVIHETGSSVDVHRLTLCCKGGGGGLYNVFCSFGRRGLYMMGVYLRAFRVVPIILYCLLNSYLTVN